MAVTKDEVYKKVQTALVDALGVEVDGPGVIGGGLDDCGPCQQLVGAGEADTGPLAALVQVRPAPPRVAPGLGARGQRGRDGELP